MFPIKDRPIYTVGDLIRELSIYSKNETIMIESSGGELAPARIRTLRFKNNIIILCNSDAPPGLDNPSEDNHL